MSEIPYSATSLPPFLGAVGPQPDHPKIQLLYKVLRDYDLRRTVSVIAGMLTLPEFQANAYRLEVLVNIAVGACAGKTRLEPRHLDTWLNRQLLVPGIANMEDPAEDAFVLNVLTERGDFRIFPGRWEAADTPTTNLIAAVCKMFGGQQCSWTSQALELLRLSDLVVARSSLSRWAHQPSQDKGKLPIHPKAQVGEWAARVTFAKEQLAAHGLDERLLEPFVFDIARRAELANSPPQETELHSRPLMHIDGELVLAIPSAVAFAVRRHLVQCAAQDGRLGELQAALMNHAQSRVLSLSTHGSRHGAELVQLPEELQGVDRTCSSVLMRVGQRRFLHFLLVAEDVAHFCEHGLTAPVDPPAAQQAAIWEHVRYVRDHLRRTHEVDSGHTFYISGLLGGGFLMRRPPESGLWTTSVATLGELELLLMDAESPLDRLTFLFNQRKEEEAKGLRMPFDNGLLNLYAYWVQQDFTLRVLEAPHSRPAMVQIATDHVLSYRLERRRLYDEHCQPIGRRVTVVRRANSSSIYRTVKGLPVYVSMDLLERGVLAFSIQVAGSILWVIVKDPREPLARKSAFELWEALQLFLYKAVQAGLTPPALKLQSAQILLDLERIRVRTSDEEDADAPSIAPAGTSFSLDYNEDGSLAVLEAGERFLERFNEVENKGEQHLLTMMLKALWSLSATPAPSQTDLEAHALQVLGGTGARILHTLRVRSAAENLEVNNEGRPYGHPTECIAARMHAAFAWKEPLDKPLRVSREQTVSLLNEAVLRHATALQETLQTYNRSELIGDLLERYETLMRDKMRWRATARAVRSLYGAEEGTRAASEADQRRAQVQIAVRALIEAATCECMDSGGLLPDGHRVDTLVAQMMLIVNLGRDSDVAHFGLASQGMKLYPNGSYALQADVFAQIANPFFGETFGGSYEAAARDYESWYRTEAVGKTDEGLSFFDSKALQDAWQKEYGHPFTAFREIAGELEDMAVSQGRPVVTSTVSAIAQARADAGVTQADVRAFLAAFGLPRRATWLAGPNVPTKSVGPWRFQRRLSLSLRPLVVLNQERGEFTYGIGMAREALAYVLDSIKSAAFDKDVFASREMRALLGSRVDELGAEFTQKVAAHLDSLGWHTKTELKMTQLGAGKNPNLGDVDVLAWKDTGEVLVVECKRLKQSRTISEIALACERFRGNVDDKLDRHLRRFKWLLANEDKLAKFIGLPSGPLRLRGPLVVNRPVPFKYLQGLPIAPKDIVLQDALESYA
jgi:hypothetical protein